MTKYKLETTMSLESGREHVKALYAIASEMALANKIKLTELLITSGAINKCGNKDSHSELLKIYEEEYNEKI